MNKHEKKEIKKMKVMIDSFGEIAKICSEKSILLYKDPSQEAEKRYCQILDIIQATNDFLKKMG